MEARDIKGWPRFPSHDLLNRTRRNYEDLACGHVSISKDARERVACRGWMTSFFLSLQIQFDPQSFSTYERIEVFDLFFWEGERKGEKRGGDERFLRDIFEFLHLNRIYHVGKYFETLERKIFGQFFEGGRSKYFLIFQLCRMLNGVDNIGKNISDRNCLNWEKVFPSGG